jgi:orotate phosphoribosyltransferase
MNGAFLSTVRSRRGHFVLESGHHSDFWLDLETLCIRPAMIQPFASELAARLQTYEVDAVCGPLNEGAFVALMAAGDLNCDFTYAERFANPASAGLFPVEYRLPQTLRPLVYGRRVAIVTDVVSAGSAVRGTAMDLRAHGAEVVAIGALLVLGTAIGTFARERRIAVEALEELPHNMWTPAECPLCQSGVAVETTGG